MTTETTRLDGATIRVLTLDGRVLECPMLPNDPDLDVTIIEGREAPSELSRIARSIREGLSLAQDDIAEAHVVGEPNPASMAEWEREYGILHTWVPNSYEMLNTARRIAGLAWDDPIPAPRA